jgi:hypothetical protein
MLSVVHAECHIKAPFVECHGALYAEFHYAAMLIVVAPLTHHWNVRLGRA